MLFNCSSSLDTYSIGARLEEIKEQTPYVHMLIRDWITFSNFTSFSTLDNEHDWEDLCKQLRDEQHMHSNHHNSIMGDSISIQLLLILHHRFANPTTQSSIVLIKSVEVGKHEN